MWAIFSPMCPNAQTPKPHGVVCEDFCTARWMQRGTWSDLSRSPTRPLTRRADQSAPGPLHGGGSGDLHARRPSRRGAGRVGGAGSLDGQGGTVLVGDVVVLRALRAGPDRTGGGRLPVAHLAAPPAPGRAGADRRRPPRRHPHRRERGGRGDDVHRLPPPRQDPSLRRPARRRRPQLPTLNPTQRSTPNAQHQTLNPQRQPPIQSGPPPAAPSPAIRTGQPTQ